MWPVKIIPDMTYKVFGATLNPTLLLILLSKKLLCNVCYRQDLPQVALPVLFLLTGRFLGNTLHRSRWNLAGRSGPVQGWGWGRTAPKTEKNEIFNNIIAPKGRVPCTIFTKFIGFMCVLSLHNSAKFRCFISINGKIINNLPLWGRFQPHFRPP